MSNSNNAFLLHTRAYGANGLLLDFLSKEMGIVRCIHKSIRQSKEKIQPFVRLNIAFNPKQSLKTLKSFHTKDIPRILVGEPLIIMMYVNELLIRLLQSEQNYPMVFEQYYHLLVHLPHSTRQQSHWLLRCFEKKLLEILGVGLDYEYDNLGHQIQEDKQYSYHQNRGFLPSHKDNISGKVLQQLAQINIKSVPNWHHLKIMRLLLGQQFVPLLGNYSLKSRELLQVKK